MNHESDNFYAEMLLKQLPAAAGRVGTSAGGARIVIATMREAGIPVEGIRMVDGSGLSSLDRLTADALVGVMEAGATDASIRAAFIGSLAVAGVSGTLSHRLPALRGQVKGKTGTTDLACTLSGLIRNEVRVRGARERKSRSPRGRRGRPRIASSRSSPRQHLCASRGRGSPLQGYADPASNACRSASPRIGTPAFSAFAAFEPGLSPTMTPVVFFETESETFAPSASSAACACSRL